jgi:hypothetical protein
MRAGESIIKIIQLQQKNNVSYMTIAGVQLVGGVAGVLYAKKKQYKIWGQIGMFFLGAVITGIPANAIIQPKIIERSAEIARIQLESKNEL